MKVRQRILLIILISILGIAVSISPAFAQSKSEKKKTTINFEDQLVEGEAQKPELFYLLQKKQFNFKRLIRLREDFLPEMRKTGEDIERKGSAD